MNEAIFILGYFAGWVSGPPRRNMPMRVQSAVRIAKQVLDGGAFNPLDAWTIKALAKELGYRDHLRQNPVDVAKEGG